jgi:hypothetical protein
VESETRADDDGRAGGRTAVPRVQSFRRGVAGCLAARGSLLFVGVDVEEEDAGVDGVGVRRIRVVDRDGDDAG